MDELRRSLRMMKEDFDLVAALARCPVNEAVFAEVAPGNARSLRAVLACGFHPVGAEVLFGP